MDDWQQHVLRVSLGERDDGKWSAFEVGLVVPRQNGKTEILAARMLAGLFLLDERLIVYSAHEFKAARETFYRVKSLVENCPSLMRRVKGGDRGITTGAGNEGVELDDGRRLRFVARTGSSGRGFTGDCVILDEAFNLPEASHGSLLPTVSARPNPQVWYASSAVDQMVHANGIVLARVRERALSGDATALAYMEWSADEKRFTADPVGYAKDRTAWGQANPALGIRIGEEHIALELESMALRTFAAERLGVGDWPDLNPDSGSDSPIKPAAWRDCQDTTIRLADPVTLAVAVSRDRSSASIVAAGWTADHLVGVDVIECRSAVRWIGPKVSQLVEKHNVERVVVDAKSDVERLLDGLDAEVVVSGTQDMADACARFVDGVNERTVRHLGQGPLDAAVQVAKTRALAGGFAWKDVATGDVTPLVGATLAAWGLQAPDRGAGKADPFVVFA